MKIRKQLFHGFPWMMDKFEDRANISKDGFKMLVVTVDMHLLAIKSSTLVQQS